MKIINNSLSFWLKNFPFKNNKSHKYKFEKSNYKQNMITQMTQPVKRKYDVLLERSTGLTFQVRGG